MFVAQTCYAGDICERLHLPLKGDRCDSSSDRHNGAVRLGSQEELVEVVFCVDGVMP